MTENKIYRTHRNRYGKFDSMTVNHEDKTVIVVFDDSFINSDDDIEIITQSEFYRIKEDCESRGYEGITRFN